MRRQLLLLCVISAVSALPACHEVFYDHYQLALTWPNEYCSEHSCTSNWKDLWDGKSLLIHGFWPSSKDLAFLSCLKDSSGHDPYCYSAFTFDKNLFSNSEMSTLQKYWPKYGAIKNFWSYEWKKHGTCYLHIIKDEYESTMSKKDIFKNYMLGATEKVRDLNISLQKGKKYSSKKDLATDIGLHSSEFYAICGRDNELDEIRVCYDIYEEPGLEELYQCPNSSDRSQCNFPMYVK